jgi:uncharacterized membrane protein YfhO
LPSSSIRLAEYRPNYLKYTTNADANQLAVFSEIYYDKGWDVYIDGNKSEYIRADYVLRSMVVPEGAHTIEFKFEPQSYYKGRTITLVSSSLLLLLVIGALAFDLKTKINIKSED